MAIGLFSKIRLNRLISLGYFPAEVPPPFTTKSLGLHASDLALAWDGQKILKYWTKPENYSIPRYGLARRHLALVNPINQIYISYLISKNWMFIRQRLKRSSITEFDPLIKIVGGGRAVTGVDFEAVQRRRAEILGSYGRYIKTDIARFYPSIYTHSIPWALYGKSYVKTNHSNAEFKKSFGNLLDKAIGAGQQGQTVGIPIGPDTSRILAELIAVEVEMLALSHVSDLSDRAVRYVDDMIIGLKEIETPSTILSGLSSALYDYEIDINAEKTIAYGIGYPHAPEWVNYIRTFILSSNRNNQRADLDSFFEQAFYLADNNPRENVMLFAVKRASSFIIHDINLNHLVYWMLYASRRSPSCLSFVAEYLAALNSVRTLPKQKISEYILQQLPIKAEAAHTDEVAWLLFWTREIKLKLPAAVFEKITKLRSSVVALIALDLRQSGLIEENLRVPEWKGFTTSEGLKSEMWLLAYEATKKGWWIGKKSTNFVSGHEFFGDLWSRDVIFYNQSNKARIRITSPFLSGQAKLSSVSAGFGYPD